MPSQYYQNRPIYCLALSDFELPISGNLLGVFFCNLLFCSTSRVSEWSMLVHITAVYSFLLLHTPLDNRIMAYPFSWDVTFLFDFLMLNQPYLLGINTTSLWCIVLFKKKNIVRFYLLTFCWEFLFLCWWIRLAYDFPFLPHPSLGLLSRLHTPHKMT